jgi:hypothetical protein
MSTGVGTSPYPKRGGKVSKNVEEVAMGGNAFHMAVGIIAGAAFGYFVRTDC